jgi:TIR domain/AAA ATPase domain
MSNGRAKPVIFISYSHKDEPEHPRDGEVQWLSFVRTYLQPAVKHGIFDLWVDQNMPGGTDWDPEIEKKLRACDVFILLVSANSMASDYIIDKEIAIVRERQANGEQVHFYPLLLTPTPKAGLDKVKDKNLRPRDGKPFSGYSLHDRAQYMTNAADEIAELVDQIAARKSAEQPRQPSARAYVHIAGLPETAYERLVGRDAELERLDKAWEHAKTNILSLVAEGGAGKSALVNEWLKRLQADNYRAAEMVLGWSFYSQGTKERATSAEQFLNWVLEKLGIKIETTSASTKGEKIAEELMRRRLLLVLDGVEPLQHGPGPQIGQLKDLGLRALLRRFAATPSAEAHGLIVLTSRVAVEDIRRWRDGAAPVTEVDKLSEEAGAALLRDNGVWGTDKELGAAAQDFDGHPLALGLLASFLKETQTGDVRRRDHIRAFFSDSDNPRHDHARRVMESYEREWLVGRPVLLAIMHIVGLFDRPASGNCLNSLRAKPIIIGLTDEIVELSDIEWQRAVARLREARLLVPIDPSATDALDAHPLVREWFSEQLRESNDVASKAAHGRLYDHLRDTTKEGKRPTLEDLAPLYQAIVHGCHADRHQEVLTEIYRNRICRRTPAGELEFYASQKLGAVGSNLVAISCFFLTPFQVPIETLTKNDQGWVHSQAAFFLRAQGRFSEALPAMRALLPLAEESKSWSIAAIRALNLSETELFVGEVTAAVLTAERSVSHADRSDNPSNTIICRSMHAEALHAAGDRDSAERIFDDAERRQRQLQPNFPILYSVQGYQYCDLLLAKGKYAIARGRATDALVIARRNNWLLDTGLDMLTLGRANLGSALEANDTPIGRGFARAASGKLNEAVDGLRSAGAAHRIPRSLVSRAQFCRTLGAWSDAKRDIDEAREIVEPGLMKLFLCDIALEQARLAFAKIEAFAPLNGMVRKDTPPKPLVPSGEEIALLKYEAEKQLKTAAEYIEKCGYHRRDEELAELQAVLRGERAFASLPPRV